MASKNRLVAAFVKSINEDGQITSDGLIPSLSNSITSSLDSNEVIAFIDSNYVSLRQTAQDFAYSSLTGTPTIPSDVNDLTDADGLLGGTLTVTLLQQGELTVTTGTARWYAPAALTISNITARVATAPTGSAVTVVVKKSGTTASTLNISDGGTSASDTTGFSMTSGQYLTVDITAIGSTTAGEELNVQFLYTLD